MPWAAVDGPCGVLLDGERVRAPRAIQLEWLRVHRRLGRADHTQLGFFCNSLSSAACGVRDQHMADTYPSRAVVPEHLALRPASRRGPFFPSTFEGPAGAANAARAFCAAALSFSETEHMASIVSVSNASAQRRKWLARGCACARSLSGEDRQSSHTIPSSSPSSSKAAACTKDLSVLRAFPRELLRHDGDRVTAAFVRACRTRFERKQLLD